MREQGGARMLGRQRSGGRDAPEHSTGKELPAAGAQVEEPWWKAAQAFPKCVIPNAAYVLCRRSAVLVL